MPHRQIILSHKELMLKLRRYRQMDRYRRSDRYFRCFNSDAVKNRGRSSREVQANRDQKQNGSTRLHRHDRPAITPRAKQQRHDTILPNCSYVLSLRRGKMCSVGNEYYRAVPVGTEYLCARLSEPLKRAVARMTVAVVLSAAYHRIFR